jgi:hypothetical protein
VSKVIGITGYAQHGKNTLGQMFTDECGFVQLAFADALRECVKTLDPYVNVDDHAGFSGFWRYSQLLDAVGYEDAKKNPEVRRLLQVMGTEVARDILGPDTWVNALSLEWETLGYPDLVITDVRFPNEAEWVRSRGVMVRVNRPEFYSGIAKDHPSEAHISGLPVTHEVIAKDMDELREQFSALRLVMGL